MRRASIGLVALAAAAASCGTHACKSGTVLLALTFSGGAEPATVVDVSLSVDGGAAQLQSAQRPGGKTSDTIEIDFSSGYPAGHTLDFTLAARAGDQVLATFTQTVTASGNCSVLPVRLDGGSVAIDGGDDGAGAMDLKNVDFVIAPASCGTTGDACTSDTQCCSRLCDATTQRCVSALWNCAPTDAPCKTSLDCCSLHCNTSSTCDAAACVGDAQHCNVDRDCCSGICLGGSCQPISTGCKTAGNACNGASDCCSALCKSNVCVARGSFCMQTGDLCYRDGDCCSGACALAPGSASGTCSGSGGSCALSGASCSSCAGCCTGVCAPFGPFGATICTPTTGCRAAGDSCASAADCCGATGSTLPGDGDGHCTPVTGASLGYCAVSGCDPEGGTCHVANNACSVSGRQDCCFPVGGMAMCAVDNLGASRCHSIAACQSAGQPCADDADCCGTACTPDSAGVLRCASSTACLGSGIACSETSQCCRGLSCVAPTGSMHGTCRALGVTCALYGQACATASDCCNNVPCPNQHCVL